MVLTRGAKRRAGKTLLGSLLSTDDDVRDVVLSHLQKDSFDGCMSLMEVTKADPKCIPDSIGWSNGA